MQTTFKVCKLFLLLCGLSTNASPILTGLKTIQSDYQQSGSPFQHEYSSFSSNPGFENMAIKSNLHSPLNVDQNLKNAPGVTTSFRDQNGNLITQVKKELFYNENGQNSRAFEFEENKQLPNGYSNSFKKEYSSSSAMRPQPTKFIQKPLTVDKYYNSEKLINGETNQFGQYSQNYQGSVISGDSDYYGVKSNLKPITGESIANVPAVTSTFRDQYGNLVTQVKKETVNNNNGQNAHVLEFEETKQLPNGYSKSFKKEYSSSGVIGSQPTTIIQTSLNPEKYYNSEKIIHGETSQFGQSSKSYQGSSISGNSGNSDYYGIKSNLKPITGDSMTNVPAVTSTFRDQYGNLVTQVKKETVNNNNGQNAHVLEFEETKQLPNGYSKSFKKEYSSSSVIGSQPTIIQTPLNPEKYYNSEKITNGETKQFGQSSQSYQGTSISGNSDYYDIKSNLKPITGESIANVPAVTSTFRDQYGNLVTQVKKETINNNNGQNAHVLEFEETKQLPNGYTKSFKKEYSSSSVIGSQPTTIIQTPLNLEKHYNSEKLINGEASQYGPSSQSYQGSSISSNSDYYGIKTNLKPITGESIANVPGVTSTFRDQYGNLVTQVKKETVNNNNGQNAHVLEFEETKQLPNGYSKSFKKEYSSSSVIGSQPTTIIQTPLNPEKYYNSEKLINGERTGETEKFNGYNTFFNNQKQPLNLNGPINSQIMNNQQTYAQGINKANSEIDCDESDSTSSTHQGFKQQTVILNTYQKPSSVDQPSVDINLSPPKTQSGQQFEKFNFSSTQTKSYGQVPVDLHDYSKQSTIGQEHVNTDTLNKPKKPTGQQFEKLESFSTQTQNIGQESVNLQAVSNQTPMGQESVNIDNLYVPKKPTGQNFEKFEFSSTHTQNNGQESVDIHNFSNPSLIGQEFVNIENLNTPKKPSGQQFEKLESFSTQTQNIGQESVNIDHPYVQKKPTGQNLEKFEFSSTHTQNIGQESIDLHDFSRPSPMGQKFVNIDNLYTQKKTEIKPHGQKFESSSTIIKNNGQESVGLHAFSKTSPIGQESVNIDDLYAPKNPAGQHFEKFEFSSTQTQNNGQESVDLHAFTKPSPIVQESVNIGIGNVPKQPTGQNLEKFEFSSKHAQNIGQESIDLHDFSKPSPIGQESINIDNLYTQKKTEIKPHRQKFEKFESSSTIIQNNGQESVDLHAFSKPSPIGQESVNTDDLYVPKKPAGQHFEKFEFSTTQTQNNGQESVDLDAFTKPSPIVQESVNIGNVPKQPNGQNLEKFEFSHTQNIGQESIDLHDFSRPLPIGQKSVNIDNLDTSKKSVEQFEKLESSYQNKYSSVGQQPININENIKSSQQYGRGQQIQGLEFLKSNYGDTTHLFDLGVGRQQPTEYIRGSTSGQQNMNNEQLSKLGKPTGQQAVVFERHSTIEKNIDLSSLENLPTNINNYQKIHGQSKIIPASQGQQTIDITSEFEGHKQINQKQSENEDFQNSEFSSQIGKLDKGKDQSINVKYNSVFDKLGQLEHEILAPKSTVNINKDNFQTSYSTNHNVKSMPQMSRQESSFSKNTNENTQYIEPESEIISSSSYKKETESVVQQDTIKNHTLNNEHFTENLTTQPSVWKKFGDKFKGTIQNAKNKAQQLATTINDKVGFSKNNDTENPC